MPKPTLKGALKDEKQAVPYYTKLKNATKNKSEKKVYASIIRDEKKHKKLLMHIQHEQSEKD